MKTFWCGALIALLCAQPAGAQLGTGQSGHSSASPSTNAQPFRELQVFGLCFAKTRRQAALTLIATVPDSPEEDKAFKQLVYGEHNTCLFGGTRMSMPTLFARGAIAEGLLKSEGVPDEYRLPSPSPAEVRDLHGVARCYTSGHRSEVQNLLQTQPGSAKEKAAVAALWNDFRACMPDFTVRLNAPWIRFLLAEALLRAGPSTASVAAR
jgi:hypothetical protein